MFQFIKSLSPKSMKRAMAASPSYQFDPHFSRRDDKVAVVTGANKGIGLETARTLDALGFCTVATTRSAALSAATKAQLPRVETAQLMLPDPSSIDAFAAYLRSKFPDGIDILINNAGFAYKGDTFGADEANDTIAVNYRGTRALTEALLPLLRPHGRIVNVSSRAGKLKRIFPNEALMNKLKDASTVQEIDQLADQYVAAIRRNTYRQEGWPSTMYGFSKACLSAYTRVLARHPTVIDKHLIVTAVCPGGCRTDMSSQRGNKTAAEGADQSVWCAVEPRELLVSGGFYSERQAMSYLE